MDATLHGKWKVGGMLTFACAFRTSTPYCTSSQQNSRRKKKEPLVTKFGHDGVLSRWKSWSPRTRCYPHCLWSWPTVNCKISCPIDPQRELAKTTTRDPLLWWSDRQSSFVIPRGSMKDEEWRQSLGWLKPKGFFVEPRIGNWIQIPKLNTATAAATAIFMYSGLRLHSGFRLAVSQTGCGWPGLLRLHVEACRRIIVESVTSQAEYHSILFVLLLISSILPSGRLVLHSHIPGRNHDLFNLNSVTISLTGRLPTCTKPSNLKFGCHFTCQGHAWRRPGVLQVSALPCYSRSLKSNLNNLITEYYIYIYIYIYISEKNKLQP